MKTRIYVLTSILLSAVFLTGCSISFKTGDGGADGGVYKTTTKGDKWEQYVLIPTISGRPKSIGSVNSLSFAMDPSDNNAVYLGSFDNGLFYSYDGAKNWQIAEGLGKVTVRAIAVDPESKCIVYASSANKVFKTTDCSRTWAQVYYDNDPEVTINSIVIDHYDSSKVYIGSSRGEVIRSSDRGQSWQTAGRFDDSIEKVVLSSQDSRIVFAATEKKGIHRSNNGGDSWVDLTENLKEFKDGKKFRDITVSKTEDGLVMLANNYGLLRSHNNGDTWEKIELITPEKDAIINAVVLGPEDANEIYYVTNTTFYRSLDGGANWTTKKLPTTRAGWTLTIDPNDTSIIYMSVRKVTK